MGRLGSKARSSIGQCAAWMGLDIAYVKKPRFQCRMMMKLSDEKKLKCLEFLLTNHSTELLHPYTKEWNAKLEEMELSCDAPDEKDDVIANDPRVIKIIDWTEDEDSDDNANITDKEDDDEEEIIDNDVDSDVDQNLVMDMEEKKMTSHGLGFTYKRGCEGMDLE
ncbi:hypothetical protein Fmac_016731 [Flemingia macrophylla]|uniref:Uncharacterized protein n=1 Tax=Flemingia macrophylla TaxID=520843 RepID=A0ABD1MI72_9FABA